MMGRLTATMKEDMSSVLWMATKSFATGRINCHTLQESQVNEELKILQLPIIVHLTIPG